MKSANAKPAPLLLLASPDGRLRAHIAQALSSYSLITVADRGGLTSFVESGASQPALVLCDAQLLQPGRDPLLLQLAQVPVLVMNGADAEAIDLEWLHCGVRGCCPALLEHAMLRKAIATLLAGETWLPRRLIARFIGGLNAALAAPTAESEDASLASLTAREREVAKLVTEGLNNKLIARQLDVTERTVKAHLSNIFQKLGIDSRVMLALTFKNHF